METGGEKDPTVERLQQDVLRMTAHAKFRAEMIDYMVGRADIHEMLAYLGARALRMFGCDLVGYGTAEGRESRWFQEATPPAVCRACGRCVLLDPAAKPFASRDGVLLGNDVAQLPELGLPAGCPCRGFLSVVVPLDGTTWGVVSLVRFDGRPFTSEGAENMVLLGKTLRVMLERARDLEAIRKERDRAVDAEKAKGFFFSTVSHDIRTPLNAIVGYSEMLKLGIDDPGERKTAIDSILTSSRTLLQLVNDVLDLSKLEAGRMDILPEPTDCAALVRGVMDAFWGAVRGKDIRMETDVSGVPPLLVDPQRLRQILFNLIGNAVKFTDSGSIAVRMRYADGTLSFSVSDTGCGIAEEDLPKLAQPFVQVGSDGRKRSLGTGLGLSIVRQLVLRMKGEVELESGIGVGTSVRVVIPRVKTVPDGWHAASVTQRIRLVAGPSLAGSRRILVVDDSSVNLSVIKAMLKTLGQTDVTTVTRGHDALAAFDAAAEEARPFELVLSDMWMPEMDGEELVRELRSRPNGRTLPIYAVTADVESNKNYAQLGFTGILLKPVTLASLRGLIEG